MIKIFTFLILFVFLYAFQSCGINSSIMFKTPKNSTFKYDSIPMRPIEDYKISRDDKISFAISNNLGHRIIENQSGIGGINPSSVQGKEMEYIVKSDGTVDLPIIGNIKIAGLTIDEAEDTLAKMYSKEHQKPFIQLSITNQRVIVFPGQGGDAKVIPLINTNTTLMEAIAGAGGIPERGKANTVKLMRRVKGKREVYLFDLSTVEGLKYTDMIVQSNDYIYVEPNPRLAREALTQITPYITLLSTFGVLITIIERTK
ncbi:MAG: polysaccharide biosynthesis/export family protein [Flavobacteriia bacterium]|nr:polysaccharide biosynthesis/export family protein [Flavobacteriia bacterium]